MATGTHRRTTTSDNKSSSTKKLYVYDISGVGSRTPPEYLNTTTTTNSSLPSSTTTTKKVSSRSYWGPLKKLTTTSKPSSIHKKKNSNANEFDIPVPEVEEMKFVHHQPRYTPVKLLDHHHHREIRRRSVSQVEGTYLTKSNNEVLKKSTQPPPVVKINDPALRQPPPVGETTTTKRIMYKNVHERKLLGEEEDYNVGVRVVTGRTSVSHVENNVAIVGVRRLGGGSMIVQQGRKSSDWKLELEEEAKLLQVKVLVTDMAGFMQVHAFRCARNTYDSLEIFSAKTLAFNLKKEFDKVYGPAWHCIVGSSFGSFVTHATGCFLYFSMDKLYVLLFRTKVRKVVED